MIAIVPSTLGIQDKRSYCREMGSRLFCCVTLTGPQSQQSSIERGAMPLGKRWIGCMLIGIGLMLFGFSRQHWPELAGFAVLAAGIVLVLPSRITGSPTA